MGLERLATLVQNVDSIYDSDELRKLVDFVCRETGVKYQGDAIPSVNTLVEHARALTFAIADGAYPSNEGRGYVLRRIIRRALRFGRQIGIREPFVYRLVDPLVESMGSYYPEIVPAAKNVKNLLEGEEKRFLETLENGMDRLGEAMKSVKKAGDTAISGSDAFLLYDTFGFPLEMTVEIAGEQGLGVDTGGFEAEMNKQRERGKKSWKSGDSSREKALEALRREAGDTAFLGYEKDITVTDLLLVSDGGGLVKKLAEGESGMLVTRESTFYGESGGQVGDTGKIVSLGESLFQVEDTLKDNHTIIHLGKVVKGAFAPNERVKTEIDATRRNLIRANHTATHLLNAALRDTLGGHVKQSGSVVDPERFRFDFTHFNAMTVEEIAEVERIVNGKIWEAVPVTTEVMDIQAAMKTGATAVFDEKYEDTVRVVSVPGFSRELCGGTHVDNTGKIGVFKILREASPGAGLRRIEAVTLKGLLDRYNQYDGIIAGLTGSLGAAESGLVRRVEDIIARMHSLEKELEKLKFSSIASDIDGIIAGAKEVGGIRIIVREFESADVDELRKVSDLIRSKEQNSVVLFGAKSEGKALLLFAATKNSVNRGIDCGGIIKEASKLVGGGGGGRKDMAQAGGRNPESLSRALAEAGKIAERMIS